MLKGSQHSFRFIEKQLQSALVKAISAAGIAFNIAGDGSILYSEDLSERPVERFIDDVVETVFPDGYYRTAAADSVKANRYRRFKQFTGTPLIEEARDGNTYFVQKLFEKLYRCDGIPTHVSFTMWGKNLDSDKTTAILGISPSFACREGEPFTRPYSLRGKDIVSAQAPFGWWELCSIPQVESNDETVHLEWLLGLLNPIEPALTTLAEASSDTLYRVLQIAIVRPKGSQQGPSLYSPMLERLGVLCDRVDIWLEEDDYV